MKYFVVGLLFLIPGLTPASDLTIPNTFSAGSPAIADEVNANFDAVEAAVDDNNANINNHESRLDTLEAGGNEPWHWTTAQFEFFNATPLLYGSGSVGSSGGKTYVQTGTTANSGATLLSQNSDAIISGTANPGTYLATFARWYGTFQPEHSTYILAGGTSLVGTGSGYGFKTEGNVLKGVYILDALELGVSLSYPNIVPGTLYRLRAVVTGTNTIDFYVNGSLSGTLNTSPYTLPQNINTMFKIQASNGASATNQSLSVGGLTLGVKD